MPEYIEREALKRDLIDNRSFYPAIVKAAIEDAPTADVVEVVRCKNCAVPHSRWLGCPNLKGLVPPPDFYCAKGKRKNGAKMVGKGEGNAAD